MHTPFKIDYIMKNQQGENREYYEKKKHLKGIIVSHTSHFHITRKV